MVCFGSTKFYILVDKDEFIVISLHETQTSWSWVTPSNDPHNTKT